MAKKDSHKSYAMLDYDIQEVLADSSAGKKYSRTQILTKLQKLPERDYKKINYKTVLEHVDTLKERGEIVDDGGLYKATQLTRAEAQFMADAVACSKFLPSEDALALIEKIYGLSGIEYAHKKETEKLKKRYHIDNREFFKTIETLITAMESNVKVEFTYHKLLESQKLSAKGNKHIFNPYQFVMKNQHYYIVGFDESVGDAGAMTPLRVFRVTDAKIYEEEDESGKKIIPKRIKEMDVPGYEKSGIDVEKITANPYMYMTPAERFTIKVKVESIPDVIDWFGEIARSRKIGAGDGFVYFDVKASRTAMKYWALQYVDVAEVTSPASLREEIKKELRAGLKKYK